MIADSFLVDIYDLFLLLLQSAQALWLWFNSAIDPSIAELLSIPSDTTYLHAVLFSGLIAALIACVVRLFRGILG